MIQTKLLLGFRLLLCLLGLILSYYLIFHEFKYLGGFCAFGLVAMNAIEFYILIKKERNKQEL